MVWFLTFAAVFSLPRTLIHSCYFTLMYGQSALELYDCRAAHE
jgi:hypothetical protein